MSSFNYCFLTHIKISQGYVRWSGIPVSFRIMHSLLWSTFTSYSHPHSHPYFIQILKDDVVKVLHSICQQIWKTQQWPQDWKKCFHSNPKRKEMPKNSQSTAQLHSSHTPAKQCSKFSKPGFSNTWTMNFQMFNLVLKKAKEPEIKFPTSAGSSKKQESSRKKHLFLLYFCQNPSLCGSQ